MIKSKSWESVAQLCYVCYVTHVRLLCNVHADVAQPSMAETVHIAAWPENEGDTETYRDQICLRVLGRYVDCFNLLTAELY